LWNKTTQSQGKLQESTGETYILIQKHIQKTKKQTSNEEMMMMMMMMMMMIIIIIIIIIITVIAYYITSWANIT
jgi:ABC-type Na+ efflux pump permease subunit